MSSDLRLDTASPGLAPALKSAVPINSPVRDALPASTSVAPSTSGTTTSTDLANPRLHTDLAHNWLVLQFFDAHGALINSIPSQKQLDAYRLAAFAGNEQHKADNT